jgi:two-component system sensor histidine kinase RegB
VRIEVLDDGAGFPAEIIDRIGEPYMTTRSGSEHGGGLGLGLFIAKTLLERSGAEITFRNANERGKGACVSVTWQRATFERPAS